MGLLFSIGPVSSDTVHRYHWSVAARTNESDDENLYNLREGGDRLSDLWTVNYCYCEVSSLKICDTEKIESDVPQGTARETA